MHSLLRQAEAPVDYECTAGSVPGRGFKATNTCSCAKGRKGKKKEEKKKRPKVFAFFVRFVYFHISFFH